MTTRKIPPNLVTTPVTSIVSEAPNPIEIPEHLQNQLLFHRQVAKRFRLVPNFFVSTPDAPEIMEKLWGFAAAAYLDNPIPTLFKERLFVFLSRFCPVRYCIVRHCGFLIGYGAAAGDPAAPAQTIEQMIELLKTPPPWRRDLEPIYSSLAAMKAPVDWPAPGSEIEDQLFALCTLIFVNPTQSERARNAQLTANASSMSWRFLRLSEPLIFGPLSIPVLRWRMTSKSSWANTKSLRPCFCKNLILGLRDCCKSMRLQNVRYWPKADIS